MLILTKVKNRNKKNRGVITKVLKKPQTCKITNKSKRIYVNKSRFNIRIRTTTSIIPCQKIITKKMEKRKIRISKIRLWQTEIKH